MRAHENSYPINEIIISNATEAYAVKKKQSFKPFILLQSSRRGYRLTRHRVCYAIHNFNGL